jgi:hypothetical protein
MVPTAPLITDFETTMPGGTGALFIFGGGNPQGGGSYTFGAPTPVLSLTGGTLRATLTGSTVAAATYVGFGLYFNSCVNAATYAGVKFTLSGTMTGGCTLMYSSNYSENAPTTDTKGSCTAAACYPSQKMITIPASGDTSVAWAEQVGGAPVAAVNPGKLVGVQWQFTIPAGMSCTANLTIDNVTFY